jgi:hypothetical protein
VPQATVQPSGGGSNQETGELEHDMSPHPHFHSLQGDHEKNAQKIAGMRVNVNLRLCRRQRFNLL